MRLLTRTSVFSPLATVVATMLVFGTAWSQLGTVLSYQKISDTQGNFLEPLASGDEFGGSAASLGDLDGAGPGKVTVAIGTLKNDDGGASGTADRGAFYLLNLQSNGTVLSSKKVSDTSGNFNVPLYDDDEFGCALAHLGDLDGPGPSAAALAVGALGDDDKGVNRGAVYVLFLDNTGEILSHTILSDTLDSFNELGSGDEFGTSVANLGDLDGPGPSAVALAVGAIGDDDGGGNRGSVYIMFLDTAGQLLSYQKISDTQGNFTEPLVSGDEMGGSLTHVGDLDGAGPSVATLAVGAQMDDDGGEDRGAVYLMFLASNGTVLSHRTISDTQNDFDVALSDMGEFGCAITHLGDLDGSGPSVAAISAGSMLSDDGGLDRGAIYVFFLDAAGTVLFHQTISATQGNFTGALDDGDEFAACAAAIGDLDGSGTSTQAMVVGAVGDDDGGSGRGAVYVLFLEGASTVSVGDPLRPGSSQLGQATPNPFGRRTSFEFRVEDAARVRIDVLDVRGRRVRELTNVHFVPGSHRVEWDGLDDAGRRLAPGTYFYRMSVDERAAGAARKVMLLN